MPSGSAPERVNSSVWQMPVARTSTITSPSRGPSRSTSTTSRGLSASNATAARVFIVSSSRWGRLAQGAFARRARSRGLRGPP